MNSTGPTWPLVLLAGLTLSGCGDSLPPLDHHGEHAWVGTHEAERVCAGTLARIDRTSEVIDELIGYPGDDEPMSFYIVDRELSPCPEFGGCVTGGIVFVHPTTFDRALAHELVHARPWSVARAPARAVLRALWSQHRR